MKIQGLTLCDGSIKGLKLPAKSSNVSANNNSKDNVLFTMIMFPKVMI